MKYFTSDTHFGHGNVIDYCKRPFEDTKSMDQVMLKNLQKTLTMDDDLYFLGDWCMNPKYYCLIKEIPFKHMYFIYGNHDRPNKLTKYLTLDNLIDRVSICKELTIQINNQDFYLIHRPTLASDSMPSLCGHVHEKWLMQKAGVEIREFKYNAPQMVKHLKHPVLNVGVDMHQFLPINEHQIIQFFQSF